MKRVIALTWFVMTALHGYGQPLYNFNKIFPVPGEGGWNYLNINPVTNTLYIAHGNQVDIFTGQGEAVGNILNTAGVNGIAFASDFSKGYTSNGKANTVSVFDINTNEIKTQIAVGENPNAIVYDAYSKRILVANDKGNSLSIIDPVADTVLATVALGGQPAMMVTDETGKIFVTIRDKNAVAVLDKRNAVVANWTLGKGKMPRGLAIDNDMRRLFVACNKSLVVVNTMDGNVVTSIAIGADCGGVAFDPMYKEIYTANGDGTLSMILELTQDMYRLIKNIPTQKGAHTLVLDQQQKRIYLPTGDFKPAGKPVNGKPAKQEIREGTVRILVYNR